MKTTFYKEVITFYYKQNNYRKQKFISLYSTKKYIKHYTNNNKMYISKNFKSIYKNYQNYQNLNNKIKYFVQKSLYKYYKNILTKDIGKLTYNKIYDLNYNNKYDLTYNSNNIIPKYDKKYLKKYNVYALKQSEDTYQKYTTFNLNKLNTTQLTKFDAFHKNNFKIKPKLYNNSQKYMQKHTLLYNKNNYPKYNERLSQKYIDKKNVLYQYRLSKYLSYFQNLKNTIMSNNQNYTSTISYKKIIDIYNKKTMLNKYNENNKNNYTNIKNESDTNYLQKTYSYAEYDYELIFEKIKHMIIDEISLVSEV